MTYFDKSNCAASGCAQSGMWPVSPPHAPKNTITYGLNEIIMVDLENPWCYSD